MNEIIFGDLIAYGPTPDVNPEFEYDIYMVVREREAVYHESDRELVLMPVSVRGDPTFEPNYPPWDFESNLKSARENYQRISKEILGQ